MIDGIRFKVCGMTSIVDAEFADRCGADYLGFILYRGSPRYIPLQQYEAMSTRLPDRRKVAVSVEPTLDELAEMQRAGFDFFQIHFHPETATKTVVAWSELVGPDKLWLAPKLPPEVDVPAEWRLLAKYFLLDTFHSGVFGGSGLIGNWPKFARHQTMFPENTWILAGGLNPENIAEALKASGARFIDVNSGVELAPGVKDHEKLKKFVVRLHESQISAGP
jgi:phosphoribosylanthranilate isomerase